MGFRKFIKKKNILTVAWAVGITAALIMIFHNNPLEDPHTAFLKKLCFCLMTGCVLIVGTVFYDKLTVLPLELYQNRSLIWKLSKNDFRKRYAGSYLGIIWALVPPIVTVVMYWFVFDRIIGASRQFATEGVEVPYVLFLTAGLVPWFFFSDAITGGTAALLEYNYLVKKVVFKISILPIIKITSALFVHLFFTLVLLVIAAFYGSYPGIRSLQLLYYTFCEYVFILGLSYATCSIVVFFRDLQQIIGIVLQVGMWATPILWNINNISDRMKWIIKLNPMTYIVEGYRSAIYTDSVFYEHFYSSTYFWLFTVLLFIVSSLIFKRLKTMFADVM